MRKPRPGKAPDIGEGKRGEEGYLGYLLRQAHGMHRLRMERALAGLDTTPPQFLVMTMIAAYPGLSNADIARLTLLTPQTVSVIVGNLKRAGAVTRTAHPIHGRIQELALSPSGEALLARCRGQVRAIEEQLVRGLSAADEKVVRRWLVAVAMEPAGAAG
ncbi:MarR family protein [bacterium YEK0313]|nr:MarR family protein [bacterium YEK0313]